MKIYLESIVAPDGNSHYDDLASLWHNQDIKGFSKNKNLFDYQQLALKNIATTLNYYFTGNDFNLLNRACFWMATGSGKTLVLIKTIEYIDYLMTARQIPKKEIMLLLPKDNLITQFHKQILEYNEGRSRQIKAINLLDYENDKHCNQLFNNEIKVYYYRSDLMRNERKESIVNYESYLNNGDWYLFLDEAHRGDSENSNLKNYVDKLTKNGFLFNFSATFTDEIDITTTCYNFNLEKFISAGYGKNIYLSDSNYTFQKRTDEFTSAEKQNQVLKSFILFTIIKKSKQTEMYHNPLMLTLVNSVQGKKDYKENSDLKMFCDYMLKIAQDDNLDLTEAKNELKTEFSTAKKYIFGSETLQIDSKDIDDITLEQIRESTFNSQTKGNLEYYEGEKGKEIVFKLATADKAFALIKIGDTATFTKEYLKAYQKLSSFQSKNYMQEINNLDSSINVLLGSRAFYEGWDSNRPNIINMINIGSGEAKKFVPQSIGRGVRIQPNLESTERKRLTTTDRNQLLETLFIFPTDSKSIDTIFNAMSELGGKGKNGTKRTKLYSLELFEKPQKKIDLLLPEYEEKDDKNITLSFNIADKSKDKFMALLNEMSPATFILQNHKSYTNTWSLDDYNKLKTFSNYQSDISKDYHDLNHLVSELHSHIYTKEKVLKGFRNLVETEADDSNNDIVHYKYIEVELNQEELENIETKIKKVVKYKQQTYTDQELTEMLLRKEKTLAEITEMRNSTSKESFKDLIISNIAEHYYLPLIYSNSEKADYINHIIKNTSEKKFIENLINHINGKTFDFEWMFSKIDETLDKNVGMPYLKDNKYQNFYPDFIFWLKKDNKYKIIFIDPKGQNQGVLVTQAKIKGFKKLFDGKIKQGLDIEIDLKLVNDKTYPNDDEYKPYWIKHNDFIWLTI
jgi:type III restriction enzyme